jgi:hypothetical protein
MTREIAHRCRFLAAAALVAMSVIVTVAARPGQVICHASQDYDVVVDGVVQPGARVFVPEARFTYLIDIPSLSNGFLVDVTARKAFAISRWDLKPGNTSDVLRAAVPETSGASFYPVSVEGEVLRFRNETSEVRLVKAVEHSSFTGSGGDPKPITPSAEARACLRMESLPAPAGTPGCAKFVYLKNTCNVPVVADMTRTEHLFSGTLPQTYRLIVAPGGAQSLGCEWWSGATAPSENAIQSAGFLPEPDKHGHGNKDHASRH